MDGQPLEMELKFRVKDLDQVRAKIVAAGAKFLGREREVDRYFRNPLRDFQATGEAFRIRFEGAKHFLTYKGPRLPGQTKSRKELEMEVLPKNGTLSELLSSLGFEAFPDISKWRETYLLPQGNQGEVTVCLDQAEGLGDFVELEILGTADQRTQAELCLLQTAEKLGLTEREDRSYLRMHLEKNR